MTNEESHFYSLLLLRLSRTKDFLNSGQGFRATQKDALETTKQELNKTNFHTLSHHMPFLLPSTDSQTLTTKRNNEATMVNGEAGSNGDSTEVSITSNNTRNMFVEANEIKTLFTIPTDSEKTLPTTNFESQFGNKQYGLNNENHFHMLRLPPLMRNNKSEQKNQPPLAFASRDYTKGWPINLKRRKIWPISLTNTTHEMIPAPYWPIGEHGKHLHGQIKHSEAGSAQIEGLGRRHLLYGEEFPVKSELAIRKLHNTQENINELEHTSYGGSFASSNGNEYKIPYNSPQNTFMKAPPFKIIPVSSPSFTQFSTPKHIDVQRPYSKTIQPINAINPEPFHIPFNEESQSQKSSSLNGLLECCQQTAPGCKNLCTKDVDKEEIKKALINQQCPPLSMTSVIQCFPKFYNVSSVATCCARASNEINEKAKINTPMDFTYSLRPTKFPQQCLSLCTPNFKLTFAHFSCIDYIDKVF